MPRPQDEAKKKRKRVHLTIQKKLDLLKKLEAGRSVISLCAEFGVSKQCVSDTKKSKAAILAYSTQRCIDAASAKGKHGAPRKHMTTGKHTDLDTAVIKWYTQQRSVGVNVRGVEIIRTSEEMARHSEIPNFKESDGWL